MSFTKRNTFCSLMYVITITSSLLLLYSCQQTSQKQTDIAVKIATNTAGVVDDLDKADQRNVSDAFKSYWYKGQAEITSYRLKQARYGEMRDGTAVLIYVTEDFLPKEQVKADNPTPSNIPVLKLNATKNFNTGIYPYSIMTSTFYPVYQNEHAVKISQSMQEWCGHVYAQLNNRKSFDIDTHSYFEGEADQNFSIQKDILENELWTQLRLDPSQLPTGSFEAIPDLSYIRLKHVKLKAYEATGTLTKDSYTITYPSLKRTLQIQFESDFPYTITAWKETFVSGFGTNAKTMTTEATAIKTIQSAYWGKNSNTDAPLRQELGLD